MNSTDTGGPAFPKLTQDERWKTFTSTDGMTLRDYFAAKALQAHIERDGVWEAIAQNKVTPEKICSGCYAWADAMLKARAA